MRDLVIHSGRSASRAIDHVGGEVGEEEEQGRAEQALERAEAAAEHPVDRPEHRHAPRLAADRAGEQLHDEEARHEQDREGEHRARPPGWCRSCSISPVHSCVWNSLSMAIATIQASSDITSCTKPRTKPIGGAADQQQEDEDVERGHPGAAS